MLVEEVAPGIHRVESDLGPRFVAQYVLIGSEQTVLVDTGLASTPPSVLFEAVEERLGLAGGPDLVVVSHADVDHCGGDRAARTRWPAARFACHAADREWVASNAAMLAGNYRWYEDYGMGLGEEAVEFLGRELGGDSPVDETLADGDVLALGDGWEVEVLALPGHTPGHIGLWDPRSGSALVVDAVLDRGVRDRAGTLLIPPRIYDTAGYRATVERVRSLDPALLLTAHFPTLSGSAEIGAFLERSAAQDEGVRDAVAAAIGAGVEDLPQLTARADAALGPYPEFAVELAAAVRDHARRQGLGL